MSDAIDRGVSELRGLLRELAHNPDPETQATVVAAVESICDEANRALLTRTLFQLAAARRRVEKEEGAQDLIDLLSDLHDRADRAFTLAAQAAYNRAQEAVASAVARRIVDLLERSEGPLRPMAIAWELEVDKFQVSRALAKLTQAGVVEQVPPPPGEDGRSRWYSLTSPTGAARSVLAELADALGGTHPDFAEAMREILEDPAAEATYTSVLSKHLRRFIPGGTSSAAD